MIKGYLETYVSNRTGNRFRASCSLSGEYANYSSIFLDIVCMSYPSYNSLQYNNFFKHLIAIMEAFARVPMEVNVNKMELVFVEKDLVERLVQFVGFSNNNLASLFETPTYNLYLTLTVILFSSD